MNIEEILIPYQLIIIINYLFYLIKNALIILLILYITIYFFIIDAEFVAHPFM